MDTEKLNKFHFLEKEVEEFRQQNKNLDDKTRSRT